MNTRETTETRELTPDELDGVAGGWCALIVWASGKEAIYSAEVDTGRRVSK